MLAHGQTELESLQQHAAFAVRDDRAFLRVTGSDATRWLNGMVTNSTQALSPGEGNYNFLLNAQGRIQGDCLVFRETADTKSPEFLIATNAAQVEAIQEHLDRFIIMDDVDLTPALTDESSLLLLGPELAQHLGALHLTLLDPLRIAHADTPHGRVFQLTPPPSLVPQMELRANPATLAALRTELAAAGVPEISTSTLEQLRLLEGVPRFGVDIRDRELPQETSQTHALHFAKGCYLGQEIVERIHSRGQVHRIFSGFELEGRLPTVPAALTAGEKSVGELTSVIEIPNGGTRRLLALGFIRREALESRVPLSYDGGSAAVRAFSRSIK
ncbi:MAG: YgfZ/GcvT domain-containing protein [Janthinobacterium lividum]